MQASRFTDVQKAFAIKQGEEGMPVAEICFQSFSIRPRES